MNTHPIKIQSVKIIARFLRILADTDVLSVPEMNTIIANLKNLAEKNELLPQIQPKLINQTEAADMLGISLANLKKIEREGNLPFKRRPIGGGAVRYRNIDIIKFIMSDDSCLSEPTQD